MINATATSVTHGKVLLARHCQQLATATRRSPSPSPSKILWTSQLRATLIPSETQRSSILIWQVFRVLADAFASPRIRNAIKTRIFFHNHIQFLHRCTTAELPRIEAFSPKVGKPKLPILFLSGGWFDEEGNKEKGRILLDNRSACPVVHKQHFPLTSAATYRVDCCILRSQMTAQQRALLFVIRNIFKSSFSAEGKFARGSDCADDRDEIDWGKADTRLTEPTENNHKSEPLLHAIVAMYLWTADPPAPIRKRKI